MKKYVLISLSHIPCGFHEVNGNKPKCKSKRESKSLIGCNATRLLRHYECTSLFPEHMQTHTDLICTVCIRHYIKKKITELPSRTFEICSMSELIVPRQL